MSDFEKKVNELMDDDEFLKLVFLLGGIVFVGLMCFKFLNGI